MQSFQGQPMNSAPLNVILNTQPRTGVSQEYKVKVVRILSRLQITLGCLAITFQIWDIRNRSHTSFVGTGIWTGVPFIVAGSLGVHSRKTKKICMITAFLVMSIIAALFAAALLVVSAMGVDVEYTHYWYENVLIQSQIQYINGPNGQTEMVLIPMLNELNVMNTSRPYQLTSSVGGIWNQPLPSGESTTMQAEAPPQAPTYLGQADPPPDYVQNDQQPLHNTFA